MRSKQTEAIRTVFEGKDALVILPTGGGKSLCYQLPALVLDGTAIIISPLVALMEDQVMRLDEAGVPTAYLNSNLSSSELRARMARAAAGAYKLIYVAPERLSNKFFQDLALQLRPSLVAVDEAHCISQWGHDFRPAYRKIAALRRFAPEARWVALTASATPQVRSDIIDNLHFKQPAIIQASFERPNIRYQVIKTQRKADLLLATLPDSGCGIIYVNRRRTVSELTALLVRRGVSCGGFHAGLAPETKRSRLRDWLSNDLRVMVATEAFGMGVDKADVRFVFHYDPPLSPESYYQQTGRAGRDGFPSTAVCLYKYADAAREEINLKRKELAWKDVKTVQKLMRAQLSTTKNDANTKLSPEEFRALLKNSAYFSRNRIPDLRQLLTFFGKTGDLKYLTPKENGAVVNLEINAGFQENRGRAHLSPYLKELLSEIVQAAGALNSTQLTIRALSNLLALNPRETELALRGLEAAEAIQFNYARRRRLYEIAPNLTPLNTLKRIWKEEQNIQKRRGKRLTEIRSLLRNEHNCINAVLMEYFGEIAKGNCGKCSNCLRKQSYVNDYSSIKAMIRKYVVAFREAQNESGKLHFRRFPARANLQDAQKRGRTAISALAFLLKKERLIVKNGEIWAQPKNDD